jgi:organic radical activating enzyme
MHTDRLAAEPDRIVAISPMPGTPHHGALSVVWALGRRCNFACSYCSKEFHDRVSPHRTFNEMRTAWNNIKRAMAPRGLVASIEFTGGEPTLNPDFLDFVGYLNETQRRWISMMGTTTNGSETTDYYERLNDHLDWVSFSTHFEWWDERQFMTTLLDLKRSVVRRPRQAAMNVNVMYENWSAPQVEKVKAILQAEGIQNLPVLVHNPYGSKGIKNKNSRTFDYGDYLASRGEGGIPVSEPAPPEGGDSMPSSLREHSTSFGNPDTQLELDDGSVVHVHSQVLANLNLSQFPDWKCRAGMDRIYINVDGTLYGGMCRVAPIGDMLNEFNLLDEAVTCDGRLCACMGDIRVQKWK